VNGVNAQAALANGNLVAAYRGADDAGSVATAGAFGVCGEFPRR
jgi:hypothetical protein